MEIAKPLTWCDPVQPGPNCHYDNVKAETPFGVYLITWKSWKDYPSYCIEFHDEFVTVENSLDAAKESAQGDFEKRLRASAQATEL